MFRRIYLTVLFGMITGLSAQTYDMFIGESGGRLSYYRNDGTANDPLFNQINNNNFEGIDIGGYSAPAFVDIDGDGDQDLIIGEQYGRLSFYRNDGTANSPSFTEVNLNNYANGLDVGDRSKPAFADMDNDGDFDMFIGEYYGNMNYYRNDGTATEPNWVYVTSSIVSDIGYNSAPVLVDIDHDGDYDLFVGERYGRISFFRNDGTSEAYSFTFVNNNNYEGIDIGDYAIPAFVDIDDDGDQDMFIGESGGRLSFYRNDGTAETPTFTVVNVNNYNSIDIGSYSAPAFVNIETDLVDPEHSPTAVIDSVSGETGEIDIYYTVNDPDGSYTQTRRWQYSRDNVSWYLIDEADISDNEFKAPGSHSITWNSSGVLDGVDDETVYFRMKVYDGNFYSDGFANSSNFPIDNNDIPTIQTIYSVNDEQYDDVSVSFRLYDTENDSLSVLCEYSKNGQTWKPATIKSGDTTGLYRYTTYAVVWQATVDIAAGTDWEDYYFRFTPKDNDWGSSSYIHNIHIDYNQVPSVTVNDIYAPVSNDVTIQYQLADTEKDTLDISCYYSLDEGANWSEATVGGQTTGISQYAGSVTWNSLSDVPNTEPSGNITTRFKIVPYDNDAGTEDETINFQLKNNTETQFTELYGEYDQNFVRIKFNEIMDEATILDSSNWKILQNDQILAIQNIEKPIPEQISNFTFIGEYGKSSYFKSNYTTYWTYAKSNSESNGGHLVTIGSQGENDFVLEHTSDGWIGFSDSYQEGSWQWVTDEPVVYTNWNSGEPNNQGDEDYAHMLNTGKWNDQDYWYYRYFIMEIDDRSPDSYTIILKDNINDFSDITIRLEYAKDIYGNVVENLQDIFSPDDENQNPSIVLDPVSSERHGTFNVGFRITDAENDRCHLKAYYSKDSGKNWSEAEKVTRTTNITAYDNYFSWDTVAEGLDSLDLSSLYLRVVPYNTDYAGVGTPDTVIFYLDNNEVPRIRISDFNERQFDDVTVTYELEDRESDLLRLECEFSQNNGQNWQHATVTGNLQNIEPDQYSGSLVWNSRTDIGDYSSSTIFRIKPADNDAGYSDTSAIYINNAGLVTASLTDSLPGENTGNVTIPYQITDEQNLNQRVRLAGEYKIPSWSLWKSATLTGDTIAANSSEYTSSFIWKSNDDLQGYDVDQTQFKIVPFTEGGRGFSEISKNFHIDNNKIPVVELDSTIQSPGILNVFFKPSDAENDWLHMDLKYSLDQKTWYRAHLNGDTLLESSLHAGAIHWPFADYIPIAEGRIFLKLTPVDNDSGEAVSFSRVLDNYHQQSVTLQKIEAEQSEDIGLQYQISDNTQDTIRVTLQYSLDHNLWQNAAVTKNREWHFSEHYREQLTWHSRTDLGAIDQNDVWVRLMPDDGWATGKGDTLEIHVDNNLPPKIAFSELQTDLGNMTVLYQSSDTEDDAMRIALQYSMDQTEWIKGTATGDTMVLDATSDHALFWHFSGDLPEAEQGVYLRLAAADNDSGFSSTVHKVIDNYHRQSVIMQQLPQEQQGDIEINYQLTDPTDDSLRVSLSYSLNKGISWDSARVTKKFDWHLTDKYTANLIWHSMDDVGRLDQQGVWLRLTPDDGWDAGLSDTIFIHLDNNSEPLLSIEGYQPSLGILNINYQIEDTEQDTLDLDLMYSLDQTIWQTATHSGTDPVIPAAFAGSLNWQFDQDLADGTEPKVYLRLRAVDNDSGPAAPLSLTVDNSHHQKVQLDQIVDEVSNQVTLDFQLSDETSDTLQVMGEYSLNQGIDWHRITAVGDTGRLLSDAYKGVLNWLSETDLPHRDIEDLWLRAIPDDGWAAGQMDTIIFHLDNNRLPQAALSLDQDIYSGDVIIEYQLNDEENDPLELNLFVQKGKKDAWQNAVVNLPQYITPYAYDSSAVWHAFSQFGYGLIDSVRLIATAADADTSLPAYSPWIKVGHITGDYNYDLNVNFDDLADFALAWRNEDESKDIGPASGDLPWLIPQYDKKIDFEDLAVFVQEWNWFSYNTLDFKQHAESPLAKSRIPEKELDQIIGSEDLVLLESNWQDKQWQKSDYLDIDLHLKDFNQVLGGQFIINYDTAQTQCVAVRKSSWFEQLDNQQICFIENDSESGIIKIETVILSDIEEDMDKDPVIAHLKFRKKYDNDLQLELYTDIRDIENNVLQRANQNVDISMKPPLPEDYALYQNFPNPFNGTTKIRYQLPKAGHTRLYVYNVLGQLVVKLVNQNQDAGYYELNWEGRNRAGRELASGLYFVIFNSGKYSKNIKLMILK